MWLAEATLAFYHAYVAGDTAELEKQTAEIDRLLKLDPRTLGAQRHAAIRRRHVRKLATMDAKMAIWYCAGNGLKWRTMRRWAEWKQLGLKPPAKKRMADELPDTE